MVLSVLSISYFSYWAGPDLLNADGTYNGGYEYDVALGLLGPAVLRLRRRRGVDRSAVPAEEADGGRAEDDTAYCPQLERLRAATRTGYARGHPV